MKNKKVSFIDRLESYFNIYLPTVKGLSQSTILSYKATSLGGDSKTYGSRRLNLP